MMKGLSVGEVGGRIERRVRGIRGVWVKGSGIEIGEMEIDEDGREV